MNVTKLQVLIFSTIIPIFCTTAALSQNAPVQGCPMDVAMGKLNGFVMQTIADEAKKSQLLALQMDVIIKKAPKQNVPLNQQLSNSDVAKFQDIRVKLIASNFRALEVSNYLRDAKAIQTTVPFIELVAKNVKIEESDPRYFAYSIAFLIEKTLKTTELVLDVSSSKTDCLIDDGLRFEQDFLTEEILKFNKDNPVVEIQALAQKYNLDMGANAWRDEDVWLNKISNSKDRDRAVILLAQIGEIRNMLVENKSFERLRKLNFLAIKKYTSDMADLENVKNEADFKNIGTTWQKFKSAAADDEDLITMLDAIGNKIPSDVQLKFSIDKPN